MSKAIGVREVGYIDCVGGGQVVVDGELPGRCSTKSARCRRRSRPSRCGSEPIMVWFD